MAERDRARELLARDALWRAWTEVARLVLADPRGWREALGWAHEWGWDTHGYRCIRCGTKVKLSEFSMLCPGEPVLS